MNWLPFGIQALEILLGVGAPIMQKIRESNEQGRPLTSEEAAEIKAGLAGAIDRNKQRRAIAQARLDAAKAEAELEASDPAAESPAG